MLKEQPKPPSIVAEENNFRFAFAGGGAQGLAVLEALARQGLLPEFVACPESLTAIEQGMLGTWAPLNKVPLMPPGLLDPAVLEPLDLLIVCGFEALEASLFEAPRLGAVHVHPALLPPPKNTSRSGVSIHRIDASLCDGPVLLQEELTALQQPQGEQLEIDLAQQSARMCVDFLRMVQEEGALPPALPPKQRLHRAVPRPDRRLRVAEPGTGRIDFGWSAAQVRAQIQGKERASFCFHGEQRITISAGVPTTAGDRNNAHGTVLAHLGKNRFIVRCGVNGAVLLTADVQPPVGVRLS